MICDSCGENGVRIRKVAEAFGKGKNLFVIENIPRMTCPHCGESYFSAETLHEIERIKLHLKSLAVERSIEVAKFV